MGFQHSAMIGVCIRAYRIHNEITVRELAKILSISPATLSRLENGKPVDQQTMMLLLNWLFA